MIVSARLGVVGHGSARPGGAWHGRETFNGDRHEARKSCHALVLGSCLGLLDFELDHA